MSTGRDRCYDFQNILTKTFGEKLFFFPQTTANFAKNDHNIVF
jgi:hypothetical protein